MVTYDDSGGPAIAVDDEMSIIEAQEWVAREKKPLLVLEYMNAEPVQRVLVYVGPGGSPAMKPFWRVINLDKALSASRDELARMKQGS